MDDKQTMENILNLEKGACGLYLHGNLESDDKEVHSAFASALDDSLCMQNEIFGKMEAKGWYNIPPVEKAKIAQVKKKFQTKQ
ncbi:MAG: spore coat protein [Oscillospiraceae bacterium]